jgi:hypothetical protein
VSNAITEPLLGLVVDTLIGAEIIEYLPVPAAQSFEGTYPFNQNESIGKHKRVLGCMVILHPHLSFSLAGWQQITHMDSVGDFIRRWRQLGQLTRSGERAELFQYLRSCWGSALYAIWLVEWNRVNVMIFAQFPIIFWLLGLRFGPGYWNQGPSEVLIALIWVDMRGDIDHNHTVCHPFSPRSHLSAQSPESSPISLTHLSQSATREMQKQK